MYQICIGFCVILSIFDGCFSHTFYREGQEVIIDCDPKQHSVITFWFKINKSGAQHLLTFKGMDVKDNVDQEKYSLNKNAPSKVSLAVKDFKKQTDSGVYTCAAMNSNKLFFGEPMEIKGEPDPATPPPKIDPAPPKTTTTDPKPSINRETWILSSLACGFVLLLILWIITILYCSHLRTSRCPHTCIIQPHTTPADHSKRLDTPL
uniref:Ig-like domain-containing protein n=1 Tax=Sinocyclocheilus grahami TaxID=75366 RepID=A0A672MBZ7_SINGR